LRQGLSNSDLRQRIRPVNQPPVGVVVAACEAAAVAMHGDDGTARCAPTGRKEIEAGGSWGGLGWVGHQYRRRTCDPLPAPPPRN